LKIIGEEEQWRMYTRRKGRNTKNEKRIQWRRVHPRRTFKVTIFGKVTFNLNNS